MDALLLFYIAGQNPTLIITRGILTRTMDTLLTFYIAGQNPMRVQILSNRTTISHHTLLYLSRRDRLRNLEKARRVKET